MPTYYNYVERTADSQINWAEVGKDMSDMLKDETRVREETKAAIDAASREFGQTLANPPQGEHKGANQWALEYADNASQFMLMQDRLLKSGQMKLKDYTVARQNILDGTNNAFNLTKDYQATFANKMERYKTDKSQDLEQWLMAQGEEYSDFNKSQLYINPTNGTLSVAMKEKKIIDGKEVYVMNKNPNQFVSISTLKNQIAGKYDKFNTNLSTDAFIKGLGEEVTSAIAKTASLSSGGLIQSIEDIRKRTDIDPATKEILYKFSDSENQYIKSALVNPYDRLSVLTNSQKFAPNGKQYTFTYDDKDAKANPEKVLLTKDPRSDQPTPQFSDEQMKVSETFMKNELRAKYTHKDELKPTPQAQLQERRPTSSAEYDEKHKLEEAKNFAQNLAFVTTGNPAEINTALKYLGQKTGKLVKRTADGITVSNVDGTNKSTFGFTKDGSLTNPKAFGRSIVGAFSTGLPEDMIIKNYDSFVGGKPLETKTAGTGFEETQKPADPNALFAQKIDNSISPVDISGLGKKESAQVLTDKLSGLGVKVKQNAYPWSNDIYVVNDNNEESPQFDITKTGTIDAIKQWVKSHPSGKTPIAKQLFLQNLQKTGIIGQPQTGNTPAANAPALNNQGVGSKYN